MLNKNCQEFRDEKVEASLPPWPTRNRYRSFQRWIFFVPWVARSLVTAVQLDWLDVLTAVEIQTSVLISRGRVFRLSGVLSGSRLVDWKVLQTLRVRRLQLQNMSPLKSCEVIGEWDVSPTSENRGNTCRFLSDLRWKHALNQASMHCQRSTFHLSNSWCFDFKVFCCSGRDWATAIRFEIRRGKPCTSIQITILQSEVASCQCRVS